MKRREATAAMGAALASALAGCLDADAGAGGGDEGGADSDEGGAAPDDESGDDSEYERCSRLVIDVEELPEPARTEARTALEEGGYETTEELRLPEVLDPAESYLADGETTYRAVVEEGEGVRRLELREAAPSKGAHPLVLTNGLEEAVTVDVRVVHVDEDEIRLDASHAITAGAGVATEAFDRVLGEYEASFATERFEDSFSWRERENNDPLVEPVEIRDGDVYYEPQAVVEPVRCEDVWE